MVHRGCGQATSQAPLVEGLNVGRLEVAKGYASQSGSDVAVDLLGVAFKRGGPDLRRMGLQSISHELLDGDSLRPDAVAIFD